MRESKTGRLNRIEALIGDNARCPECGADPSGPVQFVVITDAEAPRKASCRTCGHPVRFTIKIDGAIDSEAVCP